MEPARGGPGALLRELEARVRAVVRTSSWWERHGVDGAVLALSLLALPPGFLCLCSENALVFVLGIAILGVCHYTLTVKGSHLATHGALTESKRWSRIWALFFVEVLTYHLIHTEPAAGPAWHLRTRTQEFSFSLRRAASRSR